MHTHEERGGFLVAGGDDTLLFQPGPEAFDLAPPLWSVGGLG